MKRAIAIGFALILLTAWLPGYYCDTFGCAAPLVAPNARYEPSSYRGEGEWHYVTHDWRVVEFSGSITDEELAWNCAHAFVEGERMTYHRDDQERLCPENGAFGEFR